PNELLCEIRVPRTPKSVAYVKFAQKASGFAIAGVAAVVDKSRKSVNVGVTGVAAKPYRALAVENALRGRALDREALAGAAGKAAEGVEPLNRVTLHVEGKGAQGFVKGTARVELKEKDQGTELRYTADVQVGGLIAAVGSRMIEAAAKKMAADFFQRFSTALEGRK